MTTMKSEFLCVQPKTSKAKNRFANEMHSLHSCRVEKREDGKVFLASINGRYFFWINEQSDDHWEVINKQRVLPLMKSFSKLSEDLEQRARDMLANRKAQQARLEKEKTNKDEKKEVAKEVLMKVRDAIERSRDKKKDLLDTLDDEID